MTKPVRHGNLRANALDQLAYRYPGARIVGHANGRPIIDLGDHQVTMSKDGTLHPVRNEGG